MKTLRFLFFLVAVSPSVCFAQRTGGFNNASYSINDGVVTLTGEFDQLSGIDALSQGEYLSLQTLDVAGVPQALTDPFPQGDVVENSPGRAVLGVLRSADRIGFSGSMSTSILYSAANSVAGSGDLSVKVGTGDCGPVTLQLGIPMSLDCINGQWSNPNTQGARNGVFQLVDGEIYLVGVFENLSSIEISSPGGNLSLGAVDSGINKVEPFSNGAAIVTSSPELIVVGVLGADKTVKLEGVTTTSIQYAANLTVAKSDLEVNIGLSDNPPSPVTVGEQSELVNGGVSIIDGSLTFIGFVSTIGGH